MNLRRPNANEATGTFNRSRNVVPMSGICTRCIDGCKGGCETWLASFRGREVLYPGPFGDMTAGADKNYPLDYSHLNIQGYAVGAFGLPEGVEPGPDTSIFPNVDVSTEYGWSDKVSMKLPNIHRCSGVYGYRPEELGALRHRCRYIRHHHRLRGERLRSGPRAGAGWSWSGAEVSGDGPEDRDLQALP